MSEGKTEPGAEPLEAPKPRVLSVPLRDAWLQVLGVWHSAESELQKVSHRLLDSLGLPQTEGGAPALAKELMAKMRSNRDLLEKRVEEGVKAAITKVREPVERELAQVRTRIEDLGRKLEEKGRGRLGRSKSKPEGGGGSDAKPAKDPKSSR